MSYIRAEECLPPELIQEIQKYIRGTQIYIPRREKERCSWGEKNGTRKKLRQRNVRVKEMKSKGWKIEELADHFHLSPDSIRKILYSKTEEEQKASLAS